MLVLVAAPLNSLVVGASGAIFGVFGALAVHAFLNRGRDFQSRSLLGNVLFLLVINLVFTFTAGAISWQAHIGGLVGGGGRRCSRMMLGGRKDPRRPFERGRRPGAWPPSSLVLVAHHRVARAHRRA